MAKFSVSVEQTMNNGGAFEELVVYMLNAITTVRVLHWSSRNYAEHQALGEYYSDAADKLDELVEQYQGANGLVKLSQTKFEFDIGMASANECLTGIREFVDSQRMAEGFPMDSVMQNTVDELVGLTDRTLYKLRFLR